MRRFPVIVGAVTCIFATTAGALAASPGVSGAAGNAQAMYKAALAYAATQNVHYVSTATQGTAVLRVVGDTSPTAGTQSLTVKSSTTTETLTVALIGKTGYVRGNAAGLAHILGLTTAEATTYTNKWLSFPTGNQTLDALVNGLRNKDVAAELKMSGPFSFGPAKAIGGQAAQAVEGFISDSTGKKVATTLYVQTGGTPRPLQEVTNSTQGTTGVDGSVTFSNWGQQTQVSKPSHAVSLLSLAPAG
jgi:hypothetical protein